MQNMMMNQQQSGFYNNNIMMNNNINKQSSQNNIEYNLLNIQDVTIDSNINDLKYTIKYLREKRSNNDRIISYTEAYNKYKCLKNIAIFPANNQYDLYEPDQYCKYCREQYLNFVKNIEKYINNSGSDSVEKKLTYLANHLLIDTLKLVSEYSTSKNENKKTNYAVSQLFSSSWCALAKYAQDHDMDYLLNKLTTLNKAFCNNVSVNINPDIYSFGIRYASIDMSINDLMCYIDPKPDNQKAMWNPCSSSTVEKLYLSLSETKLTDTDYLNKYDSPEYYFNNNLDEKEVKEIINQLVQDTINFANKFSFKKHPDIKSKFVNKWKETLQYMTIPTLFLQNYDTLQQNLINILTKFLPRLGIDEFNKIDLSGDAIYKELEEMTKKQEEEINS